MKTINKVTALFNDCGELMTANNSDLKRVRIGKAKWFVASTFLQIYSNDDIFRVAFMNHPKGYVGSGGFLSVVFSKADGSVLKASLNAHASWLKGEKSHWWDAPSDSVKNDVVDFIVGHIDSAYDFYQEKGALKPVIT